MMMVEEEEEAAWRASSQRLKDSIMGWAGGRGKDNNVGVDAGRALCRCRRRVPAKHLTWPRSHGLN